MTDKMKNIVFNSCIALNGVLLVLAFFGTAIKTPVALQVIGRMHPMLLHFPIVLLVVSFIWELAIAGKRITSLTAAGDWLLLSAAFTAVLSALMGLLLSKEEGYDADAIAFHKWMGIAVAVLATVWYAFKNWLRSKKTGLAATGLISLCSLILAAHKGADITHGENFVLAPATPQKEKQQVLLADAFIYKDVIQPILQEKCMNCHNDNKMKGGLNMTTETLLVKGGKNGKLWDTTATGFGLMMERLHLPNTSKEHMPPIGKPQLTPEEMQVLYYWIKGGSNFTKKIIDLPETDSLRIAALPYFSQDATNNYSNMAAVDEGTINELNTVYRAVHPISKNLPALSVDFFGSSFYNTEALNELSSVKNNITELSVNKMPVADADLQWIAGLKNLEKLNLAFTNITGAGLQKISTLNNLRQLVLTGTKIKAADLQMLSSLKKLTVVYLWNTAITNSETAALKKAFPAISFETGFNGDDVLAQLNAPIIEKEEQIFTGATSVKVKHFINGVTLRYTLDGTQPDSITSPFYKNEIAINKPGLLQVKAFLPGWISSPISAKMFYKTGFLPDSVRLITKPSPTYAANGGKTLADAVKGELNFRDGKWLGYKDETMIAYFYFKQPVKLSNVSFSTVIDIGNYIMPAYRLEVWGGNSEGAMKLLQKLVPAQPQFQDAPVLTGFNCNFTTTEVSVLKLVAVPVPVLPAWHRGKGERGWVFVDEIFLN